MRLFGPPNAQEAFLDTMLPAVDATVQQHQQGASEVDGLTPAVRNALRRRERRKALAAQTGAAPAPPGESEEPAMFRVRVYEVRSWTPGIFLAIFWVHNPALLSQPCCRHNHTVDMCQPVCALRGRLHMVPCCRERTRILDVCICTF